MNKLFEQSGVKKVREVEYLEMVIKGQDDVLYDLSIDLRNLNLNLILDWDVRNGLLSIRFKSEYHNIINSTIRNIMEKVA